MEQFLTWEILGTYAGAVAMATLVTQLTKGLKIVQKIPTQVWSYILSLIILVCAKVFTGDFTASAIALAAFNAVIVSLASNGSYTAASRIVGTEKETGEDGRG